MRVFWGCVAILVGLGLWFLLDAGGRGVSPDAVPAVDRSPAPTEQADSIEARAPSETVASVTDPVNTTLQPATALGAPPLPEVDLLGESGTPILPAAAPRTLRTDDRRPSDIVRRVDERTLELDGRFRVTGNGSDADPYVITWEMLTSASEYVDPAQNARTPPSWVRLLDGTYVEISGYYSTAVRVALAKNLLLTLNRWDGCCIGVPPTAFDAIDITMRDPLPMRGLHLTRFGTFKGLFRAECLDAAGFLIGLYRLEDATFETK